MRIERRRSVEVFGVRIRVMEVESAFRTALVVAIEGTKLRSTSLVVLNVVGER